MRLLILAFIRPRKDKTLPPLYILNTFAPGKAIWFLNTFGMALIYQITFGPKVIWFKINQAPYIGLYKA